jgi:hypothetical protein
MTRDAELKRRSSTPHALRAIRAAPALKCLAGDQVPVYHTGLVAGDEAPLYHDGCGARAASAALRLLLRRLVPADACPGRLFLGGNYTQNLGFRL